MAIARIENVDLLRSYILRMDFSAQKKNMHDSQLGLGWSMAKLNFIEGEYKNLLLLWRLYEKVILPAPTQVDDFWHYHILDTRRYFRDCQRIFGSYKHHFPYFGTRGRKDRANLERTFAKTQVLYKKEFGDYIYEYERESHQRPRRGRGGGRMTAH